MTLKTSIRIVAVSAALALAASPTPASTIIDDPFTDGGVSNGADPLDSAWSGGSNNTLGVANDAVIGSGNALTFDADASSGGTFEPALTSFDTITLTGPREKLKLEYELNLTTVQNTTGGFRTGFRDPSSGSPVDQYDVQWGTGTTDDARIAGGGTGTFGGGGQEFFPNDGNASPLSTAGVRHFGNFSVQLTSAGRVDIRARMDTRVVSAFDTTSIYTTFDQTGFQTGGSANQDFNLDNFKVTRWTNRFDDTFDDGALPTIGNDGDDPNDTAWVALDGGSTPPTPTILSDDGAGGIQSNDALFADNTGTSGTTHAFKTDFEAFTLGAGHTIDVSFDFRRTTADVTETGGNRGFRFGLYDSLGTSGTSNDDLGYRVDIRVDGNFAEFRQEAAGNTILGGGNPSFGSAVGSASSAFGINDTTAHHFNLRLTRTADGIRLLFLVDGEIVLDALDTSGLYTTFDQLGFSNGGQPYDYFLDNIVIDVMVPAPAALPAGLAMLGLIAGRRRRRNR